MQKRSVSEEGEREIQPEHYISNRRIPRRVWCPGTVFGARSQDVVVVVPFLAIVIVVIVVISSSHRIIVSSLHQVIISSHQVIISPYHYSISSHHGIMSSLYLVIITSHHMIIISSTFRSHLDPRKICFFLLPCAVGRKLISVKL